MIVGMGVDIVSINRVKRLIECCDEEQRERIFTDQECAYCEDMVQPHSHFAARFAAKEAFAKALGSGMTGDLRWCEIEVLRSGIGRPEMHLNGRAAAGVAALGADTVHVSLSHDADKAVAVVVLEKGP